MLAPNADDAHEAINTAAELIEARIDGPEGSAAAAFCRLFYAHAPAADIAAADPELLSHQALSAFKLAAERDRPAPAVRVFNPTLSDDGWRAHHTIVEIVQDDMPFLVDSLTAELNRRGMEIHIVIHPVVHLERGDGGIVGVGERKRDGSDESIIQAQIEERTDARELAELEAELRRMLAFVGSAVRDWQDMRRQAAAAIEALAHDAPASLDPADTAEAADFLAWMDDNHFTFLGYREYAYSGEGDGFSLTPTPGSGLGLLRDDLDKPEGFASQLDSLPAAALAQLREPRTLTVMKSATRSPVHRPTQMDYVSAQIFDEAGAVIGERRFLGLFTSTVYTTSPARIPILRKKVANIVERVGAGRGSHDEKAIVHILETFPRDELLQADMDTLGSMVSGILNLQERQQTAIFARRDAFDRFVSALVYVPRDRYDTNLRVRIGAILSEEFDGEVSAFVTHVGEDPLARVHFTVTTPMGAAAAADIGKIQKRIQAAARSWTDLLEAKLVGEHGEEAGLMLYRRYADAFPPAYRETTSAEMAVHDIGVIEGALMGDGLGLDLLRPAEASRNRVHFKLFHPDRPAPLSDVLPMLENMGLRILTETPTRVAPAGGDVAYLHYFEAESADGRDIDLREARPEFLEAFRRIWRIEADNDGFNRLTLAASLGWRQVLLLRAFSHYLRQAAAPFSIDYMRETLNAHPDIARQIVEYFEARFHPETATENAATAARAEITAALDGVASLDEDRILRRFVNLVEAARRTNFWQQDAAGAPKPYVSIKFDSASVEDLPLPRPMAEIFVFSPRMEGVHLRGGKVARGGIRWSDRREDFRTEILGLMKAQMVKNTVIVPVGAKGGFIVKRPPSEGGREAFQAEGVACYQTLIRGMLDVTDNIVDGVVTPPPNVLATDGEDPYIVAAADKGTATFSDIANGISADYGFWLGDAFASGGSAGYDHKKMGITARGGWESVKRMFLELGKDIQKEPFTAVGCGDMSGDVFGNGMLLSRETKLVAAFNHMHIFVDPDPDPATSWAERKRMFDLPRSAWTDFDQSKLSKGGAIYERSAKSITLSPEAQQALDAPKATLTPNELINTILKSPVELMWFGGIGNYVKATAETHQAAGDRANDVLRINGADVRAKVIGEGANLGVTQLGRVEFAMAGGRISADFIDNSAGVDASDHEVNLKILLGRVVSDGDMTGKQRDELLAEMTDEVADLILQNNYRQGQALSIAELSAAATLPDHARFMRTLERMDRLNREVEFLPDEEALAAREGAGLGLSRPELAVLLSYAKLVIYDDLIASDLPDEAGLGERLQAYFPAPARERFRDRIADHQLGREITATLMTNALVDRMGPTFVFDMSDRTGRSMADVARAFAIAQDVFQLRPILKSVEALDGPGKFGLQAEMFAEIARLTNRATNWLLRRRSDLDVARLTAELQAPIATLREGLPEVMSDANRENVALRAGRWTEAEADADLAETVARLDPLAAGLDIVHISSSASSDDILAAARGYYSVGASLRLGWCRRACRGLTAASAWEGMAIAAIMEDLYGHQADIARNVLAAGGIEAWSADRRPMIDRLNRTLDDMAASENTTLAMASVANSLYRGLSSS